MPTTRLAGQPQPTRRDLLRQTAAWAATGLMATAAQRRAQAQTAEHAPMGPVEPRRPAPALALTLHDGTPARLPELLRGRVTAVQLMFTGCSATCPIQGAIFAALESQLGPEANRTRLLSISIDPLGDDAAALARWRQRFRAGPRWLAGVPPIAQGEWMLDFLGGRRENRTDRHTPQVVLFDTQGRLAFRCAELAGPGDIACALAELRRQS